MRTGPSWFFALATLLASCSVIVDSDIVRCEARDGFDPCPSPLRCIEYQCKPTRVNDQLDGGDAAMDAPIDRMPDIIFVPSDVPDADAIPCLPSPEVCDMANNDCDRFIDEAVDNDGDGSFRMCDGTGDCDDADRLRSTLLAEICNGVDDNCVGGVDEDPDAICGGGLRCYSGNCVRRDDCTVPGQECTGPMDICVGAPPTCIRRRCSGASCTTAGQVCDPISGECITPFADGETCGADVQCASGRCWPAGVFAVTGSPLPGAVCSRACCTDVDCPSGEACLDLGTGARGCIPFNAFGRPTPSALGDATFSCTDNNQCRSGVCLATDRYCMQRCATNGDCPGGTQCARHTFDRPLGSGTLQGVTQMICRPSAGLGAGDLDAPCSDGSTCASNLCLESSMICTRGCRTSAGECMGSGDYCGVVRVPSPAVATRYDGVQVCVHRDGGGVGGTTGTSCSMDNECVSNQCVRNRCADTCCTDPDCGSGFHCAPLMRGPSFTMRCLPNG